jgi:hypothetical protein
MIVNLTAHDLTKAVTEYVTKMGISPTAKLDIKYKAGRKGNGTTATVGIDEDLTNASTKASKASVEDEDYEDIPYVGVDTVAAENEATEEENPTPHKPHNSLFR